MHNSNLQSLMLRGGSKKEKNAHPLASVALFSGFFWRVSTSKKLLLRNSSITAPSNQAKCEDQLFGGMTEQTAQTA